jgi:hypothetical protein
MVGWEGNFFLGQRCFGQLFAWQAQDVDRSWSVAQKKTITISKSKEVVEPPRFPPI